MSPISYDSFEKHICKIKPSGLHIFFKVEKHQIINIHIIYLKL